jgi:long-chain acyl-CoA synthetase
MSMGASMGLAESVPKIIENLAEVRPTLLFSVPRIFNKLYAAVQKQISEKPEFVQNLVKEALTLTAKEREGKRLSVGEHIKLTIADKLVFAKVREKFGGRLKYAFSGGAAISREVAEFIDSLGVMVYEGYGLTETSPITTANCPGGRKIGSIGRPIPGVRVTIDPTVGHGASKPGRVEGEILVYGPNVMQGYHNRDEENAAAFTQDGGFRTGDQGFVDPHGFVYITGRIKEQYKLENGKYVVPTPLEEHLKLSPYVLNAFVYGDNRPYNVALLVANVDAVKQWAQGHGIAGSGDALLEQAKVRELFKGEVAKYCEHFKGFEEIKSFALIGEDFTTENGMLTPSLKVKRRKVMERWGEKVDALYSKKSKSDQPAAHA